MTADEDSADVTRQAALGGERSGALERAARSARAARRRRCAPSGGTCSRTSTAPSNRLARARVGESTREHLEILRGLLKAQVTAYLDHFITRRATLYSHTSVMYAGEVGPPGVLSTTFRGLVDGGTLSGGQAATLLRLIGDRRTLVIFGDRATGKSTLLNSLFELVPVDERFVAVERGPDLPALKERSFCVRLGVDDDTDVAALVRQGAAHDARPPRRRRDARRRDAGVLHPAGGRPSCGRPRDGARRHGRPPHRRHRPRLRRRGRTRPAPRSRP